MCTIALYITVYTHYKNLWQIIQLHLYHYSNCLLEKLYRLMFRKYHAPIGLYC